MKYFRIIPCAILLFILCIQVIPKTTPLDELALNLNIWDEEDSKPKSSEWSEGSDYTASNINSMFGDLKNWERDNPCLNLQTIYKPQHWISLLKNPCSKLSGPKCDKTSRRHVAVVGAGIAGLITSWVLKAVGHNVTMIEKTDIIGGRMETVYKKEWYAELGSYKYMIKEKQPLTFATIEKFLGLSAMKPYTSTNTGEASYYFLNDKYILSKNIETEDKDTLKNLYKIFGLRNTENLYKCLSQNKSQNISFNRKTMYRNPEVKTFLSLIKKQNDKEFLKLCKLRLSTKQYIEDEIKSSCHIDPDQLKALHTYVAIMKLQRAFYPLSALKVADYFPFNENYLLLKQQYGDYAEKRKLTEYYEIFNGSSSLPNAILKQIKEKFDQGFQVMFNKNVKKVIDKGEGVQIVFDDKSNIFSHYIFMTPTAKAVSLIKFDPPLPFNKVSALDDIHYVNSLKIFLHFDFPFWQYPGNGKVKNSIPYNSSGENGGSYIVDLPIRFGSYPSHSYHGTAILASYVWEEDAVKLMPYSDEELVNIALDNLETLHGDDVRKYFKGGKENYVVKKWGIDENSHGAFVYPYPGQFSDLHFALQDSIYEGRVHFGGDYTQVEGAGWIQSSIQSALYSANQLFG